MEYVKQLANELGIDENFLNENIYKLESPITIGEVYKLPIEGSLEVEGYELAYLFINKDAGIKPHVHTSDSESYTLLLGDFKMNNENYEYQYCNINETHSIDPCSIPTVIKIHKNLI